MNNCHEKTYLQFEEWLNKILEEEMPREDILAYNFGIFQGNNGYTIYLMGAKSFEIQENDWACNEDFVPKNKYFHFSGAFANLTWKEFEQIVVNYVKSFKKSESFKNSFFSKAKLITVGFDDGDLIPVNE